MDTEAFCLIVNALLISCCLTRAFLIFFPTF